MSPVKSVTYLSERTIDKDVEEGEMQKDVPNRRSANAEC
jgi:hypothetical protein